MVGILRILLAGMARLLRLALGAAAIALAGCTSGTVAEPATIGGYHAKLVDADPCMWNGDSGCTDRSLGRGDNSLCLAGKHEVVLDAGAPAAAMTASAGERGDRERIGASTPKGRLTLSARRISERRFSIRLPADPPRGLRVLHVDVRYRDGVITPYAPLSGPPFTEGDRKAFERGIYAVRIRTAPVGDCRPARR